MKINYENLCKLIYRKDRGQWQHKKYKGLFYVEMDLCKVCGDNYLTNFHQQSDFCSYVCVNSGENNPMYGSNLTENHKKKISKKLIGKNNPNFNKIFSIETRKLMSKNHADFNKENHPNWKGGVTKMNLPLYDTYAHQIEWCEEVRKDPEDENILQVRCTYCGKWYIPTRTDVRSRIAILNGEKNGENRFYCSNECKKECPIYKKSKYSAEETNKNKYSREVQPELRQLVFKRDNWKCRKCESIKSLHCHHIEGIRYEPLESADIDNCITYCKKCHKEVHEKEGCRTSDMKCK